MYAAAYSLARWGSASQLALLSAVSIALVAAAVRIVLHRRANPAQKERKRRLAVGRKGRMGDAVITDYQDGALLYSYTVWGVAYTASQDVSTLRDRLPEDPAALIGPAYIKYSPRNPANSIVLCEEWSGVRAAGRAAAAPARSPDGG